MAPNGSGKSTLQILWQLIHLVAFIIKFDNNYATTKKQQQQKEEDGAERKNTRMCIALGR